MPECNKILRWRSCWCVLSLTPEPKISLSFAETLSAVLYYTKKSLAESWGKCCSSEHRKRKESTKLDTEQTDEKAGKSWSQR